MKLVHLLKKCDNLNESKKVYECNTCNKLFNWNDNSFWYGNYVTDFNIGSSILHFCSKECKEKHQSSFNRNVE